VITSPDVVCVLTNVVALVTEGVSATGSTVIVAVVAGLNPAPPELSAASTLKLKLLPGLDRFAAGLNFKPALPSATVMKSPLLIGVVPLFLKSVPLVIELILKCVTSPLSTAFLVITKPVLVCVSSLVVAFVTEGVSATLLTVRTNVSDMLSFALLTVTVIIANPA